VAAESQQGRHCAADSLLVTGACFYHELPVNGLQALAHLAKQGAETGRRRDAGQFGNNGAAGEIPRGVTAHTIGHHPQPRLRQVKHRVLVELAHLSDVSPGC
jgi:hypothetical protein